MDDTDCNATLTLDQAKEKLRRLLSEGESNAWEIGDLLNAIENRALARSAGYRRTRTWLEAEIPEVEGKTTLLYRYANIAIIEGNEASQYGIGMVSARIAEVVLGDERAVLPVGSYSKRFGVTLSLPSVLGQGGVLETFQPELAPEEERLLARGAETLRKAAARAGVPAE